MNSNAILRDGFTFYRSFYEAVSELSIDEQKEFYCSIVEYALLGKEPVSDNKYLIGIFKVIKPNIDSSIRKYDQRKKNNEERSKKALMKNVPNESRTNSEREPKIHNKNNNYIENKNKISNNKEILYKGLPSPLVNALEDFEDMRKQINKPITNKARETILRKLQEFSNGDLDMMIKILNQSIIKCYPDVYPLSSTNRNRSKTGTLSPSEILNRYARKE